MLRVLGIVIVAVTVDVRGEGRMDMVAIVINRVGGGITGIVVVMSCRVGGGEGGLPSIGVVFVATKLGQQRGGTQAYL